MSEPVPTPPRRRSALLIIGMLLLGCALLICGAGFVLAFLAIPADPYRFGRGVGQLCMLLGIAAVVLIASDRLRKR